MFSYEYHNLDPQVIMSLLCLPLVSYKECQGKLKLVVYKKAGKIGLVFCNALRRSELFNIFSHFSPAFASSQKHAEFWKNTNIDICTILNNDI